MQVNGHYWCSHSSINLIAQAQTSSCVIRKQYSTQNTADKTKYISHLVTFKPYRTIPIEIIQQSRKLPKLMSIWTSKPADWLQTTWFPNPVDICFQQHNIIHVSAAQQSAHK